MKKLLFALWAVTLASVFNFASAAEDCLEGDPTCEVTTDVTVTIEWDDICIWSPDTFDFGTYTVSSSAQVVSWQFSGDLDEYWYVDDQLGSDTGYYTTIQISDLVDGANSISGSNVSLMSNWTTAGNDAWENFLEGQANANVYTNNALFSTFVAINNPVEFINRDQGANAWILGKYYDLPYLQLNIPPYTPVGVYQGTITYTLYHDGH